MTRGFTPSASQRIAQAVRRLARAAADTRAAVTWRRRRHRARRRIDKAPDLEQIPVTYTCDFCGADACDHCPWCGMGTPAHLIDCPVELGIFPLEAGQIGTPCGGCGDPFVEGDQYAYLPMPVAVGSTFQAVCLGCAARRQFDLPDTFA